MSERRHPWFLVAAVALLLAPFAIAVQPALAETRVFYVDRLDDAVAPSDTACSNSDPDDGDCSLRQAIARANSPLFAADVKQISFSLFTSGQIAIGGPIVVTAGNRLPPVTASNVQILANTSFGFPQIAINANGNDAGLVLQGNDNIVRGLSIYGASNLGGVYRGSGVYITGARNKVQLCFIGLTIESALPALRNAYGVYISGADATGNEVGGAGGEAVANYVSGNSINGIVIANASSNIIQNNFVGIKRTGQTSLALEKNDSYGIQVFSDTSQGATARSQNNLIGGPTIELANVIGGNGQAGINVSGSRTLTTTIQVNFIGLYRDTDPDFGNILDGIRVEDGATGTQIGGTLNNPLLISDNGGYGIHIRTGDSTTPPVDTTISGVTYIGTTRAGNAARGNVAGGVRVDLAARNTRISGASNNLRISGNQGPGVWLSGASIIGSRVEGALIGVNVGAAAVAVPNTGGGVLVEGGAQHTTISGSTISGNTGFGISLGATKTVTVTGNFIGLRTARTSAVPNTGPGIDIQNGSTGTLIGAPGAGNYIAGNSGSAITIAGSGTISTTVDNNVIGLVDDPAAGVNYVTPAGNTGNGVLVSGGATRTTITGNRIASSSQAGIGLDGVMTATLSLNNIGFVDSGASPGRPNTVGISLTAVTGVDLLTNTVRLNSGSAIVATNVQTVTLRENTVSDQGSGNGIEIGGASNRVQVISNTLTGNSGFGLLVKDTSQRVRIQYNRISKNTAGAVELEGTTSGLGAETDVASDPNHGIDPPIYDPVNDPTFSSPLRFTLDQNGVFSGYVYTDTNRVSSCRPVTSCQIQFFQPAEVAQNEQPDGQGFTAYQVEPIGGGQPSDFVTPDGEGFFNGQLSLGNGGVLPRQLIFNATDAQGNSSEFNVLNVTPSLSITYENPADGMQNAVPGQTVTYTLNLVNNGTLKLSDVELVTANSLSTWTVNPPNGLRVPLTLPDHSSELFTVTMRLPSGTDLNVRAGTQDFTSLFALASGRLPTALTPSRIMTTTVLAAPVISGVSLKNAGTAPPTETVTHTHRFTNSGNVTVTLDLTYATIDPANSGFIWDTTLSASSLEIPPGEGRTVDVVITVPPGAQVNGADGNPLVVTTVVTATGRAPYSSIVSKVSGTTGVDLVPSVQMGGNGQSLQAASFAVVTFNHSVLNTSNGPARFCLNSRAASGSTVLSYSSQNGVPIDAQGCFQLDSSTGNNPLLRFRATIRVTGTLLPQKSDTVEIYLTNAATGKEVPNSTVVDTIEITVSPLLPQIWLPLIYR